mgnify:CR=1 FL=1
MKIVHATEFFCNHCKESVPHRSKVSVVTYCQSELYNSLILSGTEVHAAHYCAKDDCQEEFSRLVTVAQS